MASKLELQRVNILCSCGTRSPVTQLYFCKHCLKIRCGKCVAHEVDSHYCPNCLENMPSAEAKSKKNRCGNCLDCPSCQHTLSHRATSVAVPDPKDPTKTTTKKVYYLACGLCRWTSRDVGMADKDSASGPWLEPENEGAKRIAELTDYYHQLAKQEKMERDHKKFTRRRAYFRLQEKYLSPSAGRRRSSALLSSFTGLALKDEQAAINPVQQIEPTEEVDPLPNKILTQPVVLEKICNINHRLQHPEYNCVSVEQLYPRHKHLLIKRSQRCRECEHNLSKPEFNPSSIKFKIQLVAIQHIPDVRIFLVPNLHFGKESIVTLMITNPHEKAMPIRFDGINPKDCDDTHATAQVIPPEDELTLGPKDVTAEYDDSTSDLHDYHDNTDYVHFRKAHKLGVLFKVIPQRASGNVVIVFTLKYNYKNSALRSSMDEERSPQEIWLEHEVTIDLGHLVKD
ncbi:dynactin subunit 4-like [Diadema antillarum]|uniref:dynactin subunit 4-like n=1 Tax=Diadema antillarum TaxID=105358 RepID=UPI003A88F531